VAGSVASGGIRAGGENTGGNHRQGLGRGKGKGWEKRDSGGVDKGMGQETGKGGGEWRCRDRGGKGDKVRVKIIESEKELGDGGGRRKWWEVGDEQKTGGKVVTIREHRRGI